MKIFAAISAALLFLFLTVSTPAFSQDDKDRATQQEDKAKGKNHDNDKKDNSKEQPRRDERDARQDQQHDDARQANRDNHQGDRDHTNTNVRQQQGPKADRDHDQHKVEGRRVERIPDDRFRASFGRQHRFHVDRARVYGQPQPIVVYGGYSFEFVNAWPSDWSFDDDCYVDYDDGQYWLFNANRPGLRIAVLVME